MEFGDIWSYIITVIGSGGITQLINWRLNKRKNAADVGVAEAGVKAAEIENMRKQMQDFYDPLVNRQNELILQQDEKIASLEKEVRDLRAEKREQELLYQKQIAALQEQIIQINRALGIKAQKEIRVTKGNKNGKV